MSGKWQTDLESLLSWEDGQEPQEDEGWTAPKWMVEGDILFFYLSMKALPKAAKLLKSVEEALPLFDDDHEALDGYRALLEDNVEIAKGFGGAVFACTRIRGHAF